MKNTKKALLMTLCAVMLVAASVMGTMAYLTSTTDVVKNTFTVGNVVITLDEAKVNTDGSVVEGAARVTENEYHLLPGHTYTKDPIVHVDAKSEECYLFVKVTNEIAAIEAATTVADQMKANGWTAVQGQDGVYAYNTTVKGGANVPVFGTVKVLETVDNTTLAAYADKTITVVACAVQADGLTQAQALEAAVFTK